MSEVPIGLRVAYWIAAILGGSLIAIALSTALALLVDPDGRRPLAVALFTAVAMTPPTVGLIYLLTHWVFPHRRIFGDLPDYVGPVFVVSLAMTLLNSLAHRRPVETHAGLVGAPPPRFLERLPFKLKGADLHAVEAQDHYLRLHTSRGSDLILLRLSDAIAELEGIEGAQTHRSWWVARAAVQDVRKTDGRATLVLPGGVEAPVSRGFMAAIRERGWL